MTPVLRGLAQALAFLALPWLSSWALGSEPQASAPATRVVGPLLQACLFASVGWFIAKREAHASELAELRLRTQEAAWTQLRAQLSPHVLLNALNGLAQLVVEDAARAAQGMRDLADVHRRLVAMAQCETVLLREERALTERYLAVESMRLEGRLSVEWDWSQELDSISVLPFLLQPLVENAIKHGIAPAEQDGKLCISGAREGGMLRIVVRNTGWAPGRTPSGTGLGLRNLRARLELAYQAHACLELARDGEWTLATLTVPLS